MQAYDTFADAAKMSALEVVLKTVGPQSRAWTTPRTPSVESAIGAVPNRKPTP